MTIDISHVSYWSTGMITFGVICVLAFVALVTLLVIGLSTNRQGMAGGAGVGLVVLIMFGGGIGFGVAGDKGFTFNVADAKVQELSKTYQDVTLTSDGFTASNEGEYVRGFLVDQGDGVFEVLEGKR